MFKIRLKNVLIGMAIGLVILFLTLLVLYYIFIFLPKQESKRESKEMDERFERLLLEYPHLQKLEIQ